MTPLGAVLLGLGTLMASALLALGLARLGRVAQWIAVLCLGVFSAFMLYDIKRVIDGGETNYVSATLAIYLDIYNVFQSLLAILGIFGGERE